VSVTAEFASFSKSIFDRRRHEDCRSPWDIGTPRWRFRDKTTSI
jgi:hypothetical protein